MYPLWCGSWREEYPRYRGCGRRVAFIHWRELPIMRSMDVPCSCFNPLTRCTMEQLQRDDIVELKSGGPKMTLLTLDGSSGEARCVWFEGKNRHEEIFD